MKKKQKKAAESSRFNRPTAFSLVPRVWSVCCSAHKKKLAPILFRPAAPISDGPLCERPFGIHPLPSAHGKSGTWIMTVHGRSTAHVMRSHGYTRLRYPAGCSANVNLNRSGSNLFHHILCARCIGYEVAGGLKFCSPFCPGTMRAMFT